VRSEWRLDPDFLTVNHGSFGATPICVRAEQDRWRERMEAQPTRFMALLPTLLRSAADGLGAFLGAEGRDIAFTDNATTGCNAVLRSLALQAGDEVLVLSHVYGAVRNTVRFVTERAGASIVEAEVPFPAIPADGTVAAVAAALTARTRLAVMDHITSHSALVLPVARIVAACHAAGVPVLVDGAHAPGQIDLNLTALGADFYAGNCHKWLCAPKGSAFLWVRPDRQAGLHPTVISHGLGGGFLQEFDWTGTRDPSAALSVPAALDFHERMGGATLRARNIALAAEGAALVARRLNTEPVATGGAMALVRLPWDGPPQALRARLLAAGTDAPVNALAGSNWLRLSAFAYNELDDFARLAELVANVIREDAPCP
jgi:isopenicillin-N epimerase